MKVKYCLFSNYDDNISNITFLIFIIRNESLSSNILELILNWLKKRFEEKIWMNDLSSKLMKDEDWIQSISDQIPNRKSMYIFFLLIIKI